MPPLPPLPLPPLAPLPLHAARLEQRVPAGVDAEVNGDGDVVFTLGAGVSGLDYEFEVISALVICTGLGALAMFWKAGG